MRFWSLLLIAAIFWSVLSLSACLKKREDALVNRMTSAAPTLVKQVYKNFYKGLLLYQTPYSAPVSYGGTNGGIVLSDLQDRTDKMVPHRQAIIGSLLNATPKEREEVILELFESKDLPQILRFVLFGYPNPGPFSYGKLLDKYFIIKWEFLRRSSFTYEVMQLFGKVYRSPEAMAKLEVAVGVAVEQELQTRTPGEFNADLRAAFAEDMLSLVGVFMGGKTIPTTTVGLLVGKYYEKQNARLINDVKMAHGEIKKTIGTLYDRITTEGQQFEYERLRNPIQAKLRILMNGDNLKQIPGVEFPSYWAEIPR